MSRRLRSVNAALRPQAIARAIDPGQAQVFAFDAQQLANLKPRAVAILIGTIRIRHAE